MSESWDTEDIRQENLKRIATARCTHMIVEIDGHFEVHVHTQDSIAPTSSYNTARQAVARVAQLMKTGPVAPQTWPEEAIIGVIQTEEPSDV